MNDYCRRIHSKTPVEQPRHADNKYHISHLQSGTYFFSYSTVVG